jgi:sarcosine oxidase subunit gamma
VADHPAKRSPFEGHTVGQHADVQGAVGVQLQATTLESVVQVSTWISGVSALEAALGSAIAAGVPGRSGLTLNSALGLLIRTGPEEFLLVGDSASHAFEKLRAAVSADTGAVTDLSHARCRIRIQGTHCRATLNKLFALDLREAEFPIGEARLTGTHHVPSLLHRSGSDAFDLYVFSTYAHGQLGTVLDAAREYGVALEKIA